MTLVVVVHRDGKHFVVRVDEKLTAFLELEAAIKARLSRNKAIPDTVEHVIVRRGFSSRNVLAVATMTWCDSRNFMRCEFLNGIAVLPFENRSSDPDNAFFTDGVQDEILTNLARDSGLESDQPHVGHAIQERCET